MINEIRISNLILHNPKFRMFPSETTFCRGKLRKLLRKICLIFKKKKMSICDKI